ncbi:MAG: GNAT family N-acetyltransferase [Planctomycetota bacterium]|nr:GNAT family N-acetyltransferase [Planctomycetota bacterium]
MIIRKAEARDAPAMARCIYMAEGEMTPFFTGHREPEKAGRVLREFILSDVSNRYSIDNAFVAEIDGRTVGSAFAFPADSQPELDLLILASVNARGENIKELFFEGEPGTWYLSTMAVDPAFRGKGAGSALMKAAEEEGARRGFARSSLLVDLRKEKAKALYERLGYAMIGNAEIGPVRYCRMGKQSGSGQGGAGWGVITPRGA